MSCMAGEAHNNICSWLNRRTYRIRYRCLSGNRGLHMEFPWHVAQNPLIVLLAGVAAISPLLWQFKQVSLIGVVAPLLLLEVYAMATILTSTSEVCIINTCRMTYLPTHRSLPFTMYSFYTIYEKPYIDFIWFLVFSS